MRDDRPQILLVSKDAELAHQLRLELPSCGWRVSTVASTLPQARALLRKVSANVIILDESALGRRSWPSTVRELVPLARVVCLVSEECQAAVAGLEDAFAPDVSVVWREGRFISQLVSALHQGKGRMNPEDLIDLRSVPEDFGEILRHEMNNPLTGILGNAELLLARRENLPPTAVQRLQTIADLAVRLRETIRRLSHAWESEHPPLIT